METLDAATADLEKAVGLDSTLAEAWYRLASLYDQEGRLAEAQVARGRFEKLKENKADRETDILRDVFVKALRGENENKSFFFIPAETELRQRAVALEISVFHDALTDHLAGATTRPGIILKSR
jgi:hypothetical protein